MVQPTPGSPFIEPLENGPLKVSGQVRFKNSRGEAITAKRVMALCRCGASKNKLFCDGGHAGIGFKSEKSDERVPDQLDKYKGKGVTIHDNRGTCSHAGFCTSDLPAVWRSASEPWIDPDGASTGEIVETIRKCPSGALLYEEGGKVQAKFHDRPEIQVSRDGPYYVRGGTGIYVDDPAELSKAFKKALKATGPALVEIRTDPLLW